MDGPGWLRWSGAVRLRIIGAFLGDRKLTTADLQAELPDVPPTSLYRHLGHLIEAGVLDVVSERRVRGTVERTYVLRAAPPVSPDELASWTPDDHRRAFYGYTAALLTDFDRYLDQEHIDLRRDGAGYRMAGMWMTDGAERTDPGLPPPAPAIHGQPGHTGPEAANPPHHRAAGTRFHPDRRPQQQLTCQTATTTSSAKRSNCAQADSRPAGCDRPEPAPEHPITG